MYVLFLFCTAVFKHRSQGQEYIQFSSCNRVCGIALASKFPDDLLSRHHWISATSTQQVVLFAVEFRCETSQRCHGIWGGRSK